ncbi:MAG: ParB/Srx family N-terminal domain-containing protein [Calditrichota bacterium]
MEPLLVVRKGRRRYIVVAGHRRLAAANTNVQSNVSFDCRQYGVKRDI